MTRNMALTLLFAVALVCVATAQYNGPCPAIYAPVCCYSPRHPSGSIPLSKAPNECECKSSYGYVIPEKYCEVYHISRQQAVQAPVHVDASMPEPMPVTNGNALHSTSLRQGQCAAFSTCRNYRFSGQCAGCVECMKKCQYPTSMQCYRIYADACTH